SCSATPACRRPRSTPRSRSSTCRTRTTGPTPGPSDTRAPRCYEPGVTTIVSVRKDGRVVVAGDGQVTLGQTIVKAGARKVRRLGEGGHAIGGFAGSAADGMTLFEKLDGKLREHRGNLRRAAVELAKDWRSDRVLRRLEAMLIVADKES